jgi:hypothetical protein
VGSAPTLFLAVGGLKVVLLGLLGAVTAVFLFFHPRLAFVFLALFVPTQFWLVDEAKILPRALLFADDAILFLLAVRVAGDRLRTGRPPTRTPWDLPLFLFLGIGVISAAVNGTPPVNTLAGLRGPILYILLLYIVVNAPGLFDRGLLCWTWRTLLALASVQILTGLYQFRSRGFIADALTGTLGLSGANDLGMFLLPFLFFLLSGWFDARDRRVGSGASLLAVLAALILCGARAAWVVAVVGIALLWGRRLLRPRTLLFVAPVAFVLALVVGRIILLQGAVSVGRALGPQGIVASLFLVSSGGGSLAYYPVVWRLVVDGAPLPLVGLGPGSVCSTAAVHLNAPLYRNVLFDYFGQTRYGLDGGVESQVIATASEFGPIGFLAVLAMMVLWIRLAWRIYRKPPSEFDRALAAGLFAAALGALLTAPIRNTWETPHLAFSLWICGTILYARVAMREAAAPPTPPARTAARPQCRR